MPPRALERIRERAQFEAVLSQYPAVKTQHFALHMTESPVERDASGLFPRKGVWLGVLIPKRWARRAVTRNTLRRQIYAVAQELSTSLPPRALVVRLRAGFSRQEFTSATSDALKRAIRAELLQLLGERLARKLAASAAGDACA